jgi:hypothetical protein
MNGIKTFFSTNFLHFLLRLIIEIGMITPLTVNVRTEGTKSITGLLISGACPASCKNFLDIIATDNGTKTNKGYQILGIAMTSSSELI